MSKRQPRTPKYRHHTPSGQAVVTLSGKDVYLGKYGSIESHQKYARVVAEWEANQHLAVADTSDMTVTELIARYMQHAESYYRKDGKPTSEVSNLKHALGPLRRLYGGIPAREFSPLRLEAVRNEFVQADVSRTVTNAWTRRIVAAFKWAVSKELCPVTTYQALATVRPLQRGRSDARETKPVRPVPEPFVDAVLGRVSPPVKAILELMRASGMRPGEACEMRTCDLDTSGRVWIYRPGSHKTEHHGKTREIYLGPQAQAILKPWLRPELEAYLFSPERMVAARHAEQRRNRKTPVRPHERLPQRKANPKVVLRERYTANSLNHAVQSACELTGTPYWTPNQLRHNAATYIRREYGIDMARIILGHSDMKTTEIYAEQDREKAMMIMGKIG
jgi:integrase